MSFEFEDLEIFPRRFLMEDVSNDETLTSPNDSSIVRTTLKAYGSIYLVLIALFCCLRVRYPHTFNIRAWVPEVQCDLAKEDHFGAINWFWKVWSFKDDDIREQCGMDGLCFLRIYRFGLKIALVGMFNSLWLMPVYATSQVTSENEYITDPLARVTVGYIPPRSPRFIATVIAAYIHFGSIMYFLLQEFKWFTYHRHAYLMATEPRNYTVYVSHIPSEYRSSSKLLDYFRSCFSPDAVLEAQVALNIPKLQGAFGAREKLVSKLEHAINIEEVKGKTPMHRDVLHGSSVKVNSIECFSEDLNELNDEIKMRILEIENLTNTMSFQDDLEAEGGSVHYTGSIGGGGSVSEQSSLSLDDTYATYKNKFEPILAGLDETNGAIVEDPPLESFTVENGEKKFKGKKSVLSSVKSKTGGAFTSMKEAGGNATAAGMSMMKKSDDGNPREAGFVTFANLKTTQAALQQIHHETPFVMEVAEAPQPDDIFWMNVGKNHKSLQTGKLLSFTLTAVLCIFWTIPVAFIVTLTEVESLKKTLTFLEDWVEAWPALEGILAQLAPLILIAIKELLPIILGIFSALEGPVSSSVLEASLFYKLAIFEIIQTFFVSAISGSITSEITNIINNPTSAITFLATSIPGQSSYFMQILFVQTFLGQVLELLRVSPLAIAWARSVVGPNLTEKERNTTWLGIRPLTDPREFEFADIVSNGILYFMVVFVYGTMAPVTNWFLAFCFIIMISGYRHQLVYNYPPTPDSGGQLWISFFSITQTCLLIAEITLVGFLALKEATIATPLMVPLIIITILFNVYIKQRHFLVSSRLPSRAALKRDLQNQAEGPMNMSFVKGKYVQQALQSKEDIYPENFSVAREIAQQQIAFMTPPGSEADINETEDLLA
jgi:hypothetical protein